MAANILRCLIIVLWQAIGLAAFAQDQDIRFEHLGTAQGLSQSNPTCILRDNLGFMWFGTRDGLNRYDGYAFTVYKNVAGDEKSISNNSITSIIEDKRGRLWIGTWGGGLNRFDREKNKFVQYKHDKKNAGSLSNDIINSLMLDAGGDIWIGMDGGGLDMLDPATALFSHHVNENKDAGSISDNDVTNILEDSRGAIWVGTAHGGLNLFNKKNGLFTRFLHDDKDHSSLSCNIVMKVFEDRLHRIWIGTRGGGLELWDPIQRNFRHFINDPLRNNSLAHNAILTICGDEDGKLWIGTENGGLSVMDPELGSFHNYRHDDIDNTSLSNNSIYAIYKDIQGTMWVGTYSGGVNVFNRDANKFTRYKHNTSPQSLSNNNVWCLFEDSGSNLWLGTDGGGLERMDRQTGDFTHFIHKAGDKRSIGGNYVLSVQEDNLKNLWVGTWGDGLTIIDKKREKFTHYHNDPADRSSLSGNNVYAIAADKDGSMWIGTFGEGLNLYDQASNSFRHYKHEKGNANSISSDRIQMLICDHSGYLWIGTFDGGVDRFDKKTNVFTHYQHDDSANSLSSNSVNCIFEDSRKNLWIGTNNGLDLLDRKTGHFTAWSTGEGLPNALVFGILEGRNGNLWISTNNGLSQFDPKSHAFKNYSMADGLQSNEFKAHSCLKGSSGKMYFGGVNGFNEFLPDSIKEYSFDPPLVITGFQIFNKEVPISGDGTAGSPLKKDITETSEITLSYKNSVVTFEFASLNYIIEEKKQYAYRLEGFDKKWNNIGMRRTATYTNLDPGTYVFEVKGLNNDGQWSPDEASLRLIITPPFWMTWWFRSLVAISLAGAVIAFYKIHIRKIKRQKEALERQVVILDKAVAQGKFEMASDVLHDIGNAIVGFGSYLTRVRRLLDQEKPENLEKLAGFFGDQQPAMVTAIGEAKADAVVKMLIGTAQTQKTNQEEMSRSITEQLNIINHIQEILHIQRQYISGKETQERKPVNIRTVINDSLSMLFSSIEKNVVAVSLAIPEGLPLIKGDRTKLMQLTLSLLKNSLEAIDAQAPEKSISIRAQRQEDQLIIAIEDSGAGFDKETSSRFFERGFTTKFSGAGLGLYNCLSIVESHEASIELTSKGRNKGALATIRFKL